MASFVAKDEAAKVTAPMPVAAPPPSGYDELAQLRKDLNSLKVEKKTLLTLVKTAAKQKQSWNRLTPEDLMGAIDPLLRDYDSLNSAYWYLILYGVLRFKDINGGWKYDTYRPSMKFAQIAPRGVALLNALARES